MLMDLSSIEVIVSLIMRDADAVRRLGLCTYVELAKGCSSFRDVIECWKRNILHCRDITDDILNPRPNHRYIEVVYVTPYIEPRKAVIVYEEGAEKEKAHPLVLAAYEKCLGKKTVF